jgi:hypothetical protein
MPLHNRELPLGDDDGNRTPSIPAVKLSEIYAWTVDFFGLQKGDSFKSSMRACIDTNSLGAGESSELNSHGQERP